MAEKNGVQKTGDGTQKDGNAGLKDKARHWAIIGGVGLLGIIVVATVVPIQWSNFVARIVNESLLAGIFVGLAIGFVCTFIPYWLFSTGWRKRQAGSSNIFLIIGLIVAIPNLITLWIVLRVNSAARNSDRTLTTEAPGFKLGTLLGVIAAIALAVFFWNLRRQRDQAKAEAAKEHERAEAAAATNDTTRVVEHQGSSSSGSGGGSSNAGSGGGSSNAGSGATTSGPESSPDAQAPPHP